MEQVIDRNPPGVCASVSYFGIPHPYVHVKNTKIPVMLFLGKNDPIVNYEERTSRLPGVLSRSQVNTISYDAEGHWIRKRSNMASMIEQTIEFLSQNKLKTYNHEKSNKN
jgi:predicted esterase